MYVFVYVCLHVYRYLQRLEGVGSLELELLADVNHLTWVLGTELGSSGRAARAANHRGLSPAPMSNLLTVELDRLPRGRQIWERQHK